SLARSLSSMVVLYFHGDSLRTVSGRIGLDECSGKEEAIHGPEPRQYTVPSAVWTMICAEPSPSRSAMAGSERLAGPCHSHKILPAERSPVMATSFEPATYRSSSPLRPSMSIATT